MRVRPIVCCFVAAAVLPGGFVPQIRAQEVVVEERMATQYQPLRLVRLTGGLEVPWGVAFLPDNRLLVTDRPGRLYLIANGQRTEVTGAPRVFTRNQGGLLDVVPHPRYEQNGWIYMTYSSGDSAGTVTALARARIEGTRLVGLQDIFRANTPQRPGTHYGSRILFVDDSTLLMSVGDRGAEPGRAQNTRDHSGSIVRLRDDGRVPPDNPFVGNPTYAPEIYTYGHRNIQGLARRPETGETWATEHGPRGGDLLQHIVRGQNYGWPVVSRGRGYRTQEQYGEAREAEQFHDPVWEFLPTLAPSGLTVVRGGRWHDTWQGNLLAGGLRSQRILRVVLENRTVVHIEELLLQKVGRIRDVRLGPDGNIYVAAEGEEEGAIYRVEPAN